jgi:hypothetical protein
MKWDIGWGLGRRGERETDDWRGVKRGVEGVDYGGILFVKLGVCINCYIAVKIWNS